MALKNTCRKTVPNNFPNTHTQKEGKKKKNDA